jgi:hypothetical protein
VGAAAAAALTGAGGQGVLSGVFRWGEGDGQDEGVEPADVAGDLAFGANAVVVEV